MREAMFAARPAMSDDVLFARDGHLGRIMLNRPRVLNVLNDNMVSSILAQGSVAPCSHETYVSSSSESNCSLLP